MVLDSDLRQRGRSLLPSVLLLLLRLAFSSAVKRESDTATYAIWGTLVPKDEPSNLEKELNCFHGAGYTSCEHQWNDIALDDPAEDARVSSQHHSLYFAGGEAFCLECCSNTRLDYSMNSTWKLHCLKKDASGKAFHILGEDPDLDQRTKDAVFEFRFARRETFDDATVTKCDLQRTPNSTKPMVGYDLSIEVVEHSEGMNFWRGVTSCSAAARETLDPSRMPNFEEYITLIVSSSRRGEASAGLSLVALLMIPLLLLFDFDAP